MQKVEGSLSMEKSKIKLTTRQEVPTELTWNLENLFKSNEAWEKELVAIQKALPTITQYQGKLHESPKTLLECLLAQEQLQKRVVLVATYANLRFSEDASNTTNQENAAKVATALSSIGAALSFIESEILALPEEKVHEYLEAEYELQIFKKYLQDILEKSHIA